MVVFLPVAAAFGVSFLITFLLMRWSGALQVLDYPNERSLHSTPIPRTGGLAIWAGGVGGIVLVGGLLGTHPALPWIAVAAIVIGIVSFVDDRSHVLIGLRLAAHVVAAALLVAGGLGLESIRLPGLALDLPAVLGLPVSVLFAVWMINLYNFMDGMDGFAGGMGVFGFGTLALLGYLGGDFYFAALCATVAAAAGGFLVWNFPPARVFMGDTGASALGLLAVAFSLWGDRTGLFPLWISVLVFSPFIADATATLVRRAMRKERVWQAHRSHYYQRLVRLGWGHRKTVLVEYVLMAACGVTAVLVLEASPGTQWVALGAWGFVYILAFATVGRLAAGNEAGLRPVDP